MRRIEKKKVRTVKKSHKVVTFRLFGEKPPTAPIETKICLVGHLADIITYAKFQVKFFGVTILQGVELLIFLLIFAWALQQCSATVLPVIYICHTGRHASYLHCMMLTVYNGALLCHVQITTLVNAKEKPVRSERTLSALVRVGQAVNLAVERFVGVGEAIACDNPEIQREMCDACRDARAAGMCLIDHVYVLFVYIEGRNRSWPQHTAGLGSARVRFGCCSNLCNAFFPRCVFLLMLFLRLWRISDFLFFDAACINSFIYLLIWFISIT